MVLQEGSQAQKDTESNFNVSETSFNSRNAEVWPYDKLKKKNIVLQCLSSKLDLKDVQDLPFKKIIQKTDTLWG